MYIGLALEPHKKRWAKGKGYKNNPEFWKCINEVGWDNITHEIMVSGIESRNEAQRIEAKLIKEYDCMEPKGFNRRNDDGRSYISHKREIGRRYGHCVVLDYRPDEDGYKLYKLQCECGKVFKRRGPDITDNTNCGCMDN